MIFLFILGCASLGLSTFTPKNITTGSNPGGSNGNTLTVLPNKDLSSCVCDVSDQCDPNCCCDPDCSGIAANTTFPFCLVEKAVIVESEKRALRYCSEPDIPGSGTLIDWFQKAMLCVERVNNPSTGTFYDISEKNVGSGYIDDESSLFSVFSEYNNTNSDSTNDSIATTGKALARGYLFNEEILDANNNTININAPSSGNFCNESNVSLLFGSDLDFVCYSENTLTNYQSINDSLSIESLPYIFNSTSFKKHPDGILNGAISKEYIVFSDKINTSESVNVSEIYRSIDIYYSTVGTTKNPHHVLENIVVKYGYSTTNALSSSGDYFDKQVNMIAFRTIVRYFENPNSVNLFKGTSVDRRIQAWLPF